MRIITDDTIIAGIREATAAWNAPQDTGYYAARWHVTPGTMRGRLLRMAAAGKLAQHRALACARLGDTWTVRETP